MNLLIAYTDGSCNCKTWRGGAGAYLVYSDSSYKEKSSEIYISKGFSNTKTGRMEIMAVILTLESIEENLKKDLHIHIISDSMYVVNSARTWVFGWEIEGGLESRTNGDLWKRFLKIYRTFPFGRVEFFHVKGHTGVPGNEKADSLAGKGYKSDEFEQDLSFEEVERLKEIINNKSCQRKIIQ